MPFQQTTIKYPLKVKNTQRQLLSLSMFSVIVIGILLGLISLINCANNAEFYLLKTLQLVLFFVLGNFYISQKKRLSKQLPELRNKNQMFPLTVILCVLLSTAYIVLKRENLFMAFSSSASFLLPYFLTNSWMSFINIPAKEYNTWIPKTLENKVSIFLDSINIKLKVARCHFDKEDKIYSAYAPYYIKLGDFFSRFIQEKNRDAKTAIEDADKNDNKYAWNFFSVDRYGLQSKRLDPNLTLLENKIKQYATIYIKREKQPVKLLTYQAKKLLNETVEQ